jgi:ABC-2 type transport system permease protein
MIERFEMEINSFLKLTLTDMKLFSRSGVEMFFTFAFPILNVLLFGGMYGNEPSAYYGGRGAADVMIPGYIAALVIGTTAFMNLPLEIASRRQSGVLRRFRASPLHPLAVVGSQVVVGLVGAVFSTVIMIFIGRLVYGAALPVSLPLFLLGFGLSCLGLYALTFLMSNFVRSVGSARALFMAIFFPMMFISGGTLPLQFLPKVMQDISALLPLTYAVNLMKGVYLDGSWNWTAAAVMGGLLIICPILAIRFFRWE